MAGASARASLGLMPALVLTLVLAAGVAGWVAISDGHAAAMTTARRTDQSLAQSLALAETASALAEQVGNAVDALVTGTASAGESMSHTIAISKNVRSLLDVVARLDNLGAAAASSLTAVSGGLADAEAALLETQGGLGEANTALVAVQTQLAGASAQITAVTQDLRTALSSGSGASSDIDRQQLLSRVTLLLAVLAAICMVLWTSGRRQALETQQAQP